MFFDLSMLGIQQENKGYSICQIVRNNGLSNNVLLKIDQHIKSNLIIYKLSMLFSYNLATEKFNISFLHNFQSLSNKWSAMKDLLNDIWLSSEFFFGTYQFSRYNLLYILEYLIFSAFWGHSVLLRIDQYTNNLMIYNSRMFGK